MKFTMKIVFFILIYFKILFIFCDDKADAFFMIFFKRAII